MSKSILILGAGRSSASLIQYLSLACLQHGWLLAVGDYSLQAAVKMTQGLTPAVAIQFDIQNKPASSLSVQSADIVISLLPAHLHYRVAELCLELSKHLITASYVNAEMQAFHTEAAAKGLLFLNECGLDPGIDHMSAMQLIDGVKAAGGRIGSFYSFTGGLISPVTDPENPWRYKFTWNSRNVVMAGQSTAKYLEDGVFKYIPYQQLFTRLTSVSVPGLGEYEGYANRDSLKYISTYGLDSVRTMLRGTLRNKGFCSAWNILVQLGCCDDSFQVDGLGKATHREFIGSFLPATHSSLHETIERKFGLRADSHEMKMLQWLGLFSDEPVGLPAGSPAQALEHILNKKWKLNPNDQDQIIMWHKLNYTVDGNGKEIQATLVSTGENSMHTAMAKTVGLPLGIAAELLAEGKIKSRGVVIPTTPEFYSPILAKLASLGIEMQERAIS